MRNWFVGRPLDSLYLYPMSSIFQVGAELERVISGASSATDLSPNLTVSSGTDLVQDSYLRELKAHRLAPTVLYSQPNRSPYLPPPPVLKLVRGFRLFLRPSSEKVRDRDTRCNVAERFAHAASCRVVVTTNPNRCTVVYLATIISLPM